MALVRDIEEKGAVGRNKAHGEVKATYEVFTDGGHKYVQINSLGSSSRVTKGAVSQVLQFDESGAKALVSILRKEFEIL